MSIALAENKWAHSPVTGRADGRLTSTKPLLGFAFRSIAMPRLICLIIKHEFKPPPPQKKSAREKQRGNRPQRSPEILTPHPLKISGGQKAGKSLGDPDAVSVPTGP